MPVAANVNVMSVMRSRREPPMLRVPAWKSASHPHENDWISSSAGSWMSCCQRGDALEVGMFTGYGRVRQL